MVDPRSILTPLYVVLNEGLLHSVTSVLTSQRDRTVSVRSNNRANLVCAQKNELLTALSKCKCFEKANNHLAAVDFQSIEPLDSNAVVGGKTLRQ